jgi:glutamate synthase (NADPH/NADH) small chain
MAQLLEQHPEISERFRDLKPALGSQAAVVEANRCLNCFDAPCTAACPTHIDVPRFIKKIATGNLLGSASTILDANVLGASCSRVCPVEVLCEGSCVMHGLNKQPIAIGRLQRYAMDNFFMDGGHLERRTAVEHPLKVACLGAGPASLACAAELRQRGISVTVIERKPLAGGLNTYGVAEYKLRSADSLREVELVRSLGVEFKFGVEIATEADFARLESEYDAIFIGVGLGAMKRLGIPGDDHPDVVDALGFIARYKTSRNVQVGKRVVVVGAGNTAIDAANAAHRLGAEDVRIVYRRTAPDMPAFDFEFEHAKLEGVRFEWLAQPIAIHKDETSGNIRALECLRGEITGATTLRPIQGSNFEVPCDMVIPAIGQSSFGEMLGKIGDVQIVNGVIAIDRATGQTANPKYFAGGDCVNGGREVVDAVADGKRAAIGIARFAGVAHG